MSATKEYALEKVKYSYKLMKQNKLFEKGRACIVENGKVLVLEHDDTKKRCIPGGGVDEGETIEECVAREAYEESGLKIKPICKIAEHFYDVEMSLDEENFISKRVEYIYLCKIISQDGNGGGIDGEFACAINKLWLSPEEMINIKFSPRDVDSLKTAIEKYNL